jgi:hypothetical protein
VCAKILLMATCVRGSVNDTTVCVSDVCESVLCEIIDITSVCV